MKNNIPIYIVIGTRAQFIKVAPLMSEMLNQKLAYTLINTAQHRENIDDILNIYHLPAPNIMLNDNKETDTQSSCVIR
jgi:UDP-N-acetylglucosamine 2-epimerase (non-hydrolysing)